MVSGLINANPTVYEKKERRVRSFISNADEYAVEPIDQQEIFDILFDLNLMPAVNLTMLIITEITIFVVSMETQSNANMCFADC